MTMSAIMTETEIESQDSSSDGSNYCHRDAGWPYYTALLIFFFFLFAFSALTLLVGRQEEHVACKN